MGWRLSLGLATVPAVIFTLGTLMCPDSPNSTLEKNPDNLNKARAVCCFSNSPTICPLALAGVCLQKCQQQSSGAE